MVKSIDQRRTRDQKVAGSSPGRAQELCQSRGGRPGLPVPNSPYGLCGRKATLNLNSLSPQRWRNQQRQWRKDGVTSEDSGGRMA